MSSIHLTIISVLLTIILPIRAENSTRFFTKSSYDLWCQENLLSHSLLLYPDPIPIGITRTSTIKSVNYQLIDDTNNGLFQVKARRVADFYFLLLNLTRPLEINREYQDLYRLEIQASIITNDGNQSEQVQLRLHVADSNDNDGVFDMDIYEQSYTTIDQTLVQFHASDADEIQHAQIFYELASPLNETFHLHPFTGQLYLVNASNIQSNYEFDVFAYDRYRKRFVDNNMKTKTHVKLEFNLPIDEKIKQKNIHRYQTISNQTIEVSELFTSVPIQVIERERIDLFNLHQPILIIDFPSNISFQEIFLLNTSSNNVRTNLFLHRQFIYFNRFSLEEYHLEFLVCFNVDQCQTMHYRYLPWMNWNISSYQFPTLKPIEIDDNLPVDSFLTRLQLSSTESTPSALIIQYKLLNDEKFIQFYLHPRTGVLRLAERLTSSFYRLDIQANIQLYNRRYSIETTFDIHVRDVNKYSPKFVNNTPTEFFQLPYQFQTIDLDQNRSNNGRISYRLAHCWHACPFQIDPTNGTLSIVNKSELRSVSNQVYHLEVIAFDWGQPVSLSTRWPIRIDLSSKLNKRDLSLRTRSYSRKWKKKFTSNPSQTSPIFSTTLPNSIVSKTVYLNVGFRRDRIRYEFEETQRYPLMIDRLQIEYEDFPWPIDDQMDNLFFYMINDTNVPFIIDQQTKQLILIDELDREKQNEFVFEIELKFKSIYATKFQEDFQCETNERVNVDFQYTSKFYQKLLVQIIVKDVNDHRPTCLNHHIRLSLNENEKKENLYQVQAFDLDLGENGSVIYSLLNFNEYFSIHPSTGQIDCIQSIDYETISFIDLHILTSDQGREIQLQSICMTVHIDLIDLNDNTPSFSLDSYRFDLFFDMPRYSIFGQIYAKDADEKSQLTYSLNANPYLTINPVNGHLRLKHHLYRLVDQIFNVTARVSDGLHTNQCSIFIQVKSFVDAQQPILLSEPAYALTLNESFPVNQSITNIFRRFQLIASTIDTVEIINDDYINPFSIDSQGVLRLSQALVSTGKTSFWLPIRLTRYRARPAHSFVHLHINVRAENLYLPQCQTIYQQVRVYDFAIQQSFARIQAFSSNRQSQIQYRLIFDRDDEKIFSIEKQSGAINLLSNVQNSRRLKSDYLLTIEALETPSKLSTNCFVKVHLIRRRQLIPRFFTGSKYQITLPELTRQSGKLRQRLFQIVALLDHQVYDRKIEIRYRMIGGNEHFILNRQTGYIAAKQPLNAYTNYELTIEAFTVAHRDEIISDGNDQDDDDQSQRTKGRVVSTRISLPVEIRVTPTIEPDRTSLSTIDSTINIDLLSTTEVGSTIFHLGMNNRLGRNESQWFILIGNVRQTRYFHVDFQTGQLILLRPIDELINETNLIELKVNVTRDWIKMNTMKILLRLVQQRIPTISFAQTDYYSSISKSVPVGVEIARLTIDHGYKDCRYSIENVEKLYSKTLFRIDSNSGAIFVNQSLEKRFEDKHLLTIVYRCDFNGQMTSTRLHMKILEEKSSNNSTKKISYRFREENPLILFESSLIKDRRKILMKFDLINDENRDIRQPNAEIVDGDPLNLFEIDRNDQTLIFRDESRARSYVYPLVLKIIDRTFSSLIECQVTIFISNIGIYFPCPSDLKSSPFLFTYESTPSTSIDFFTGQRYSSVQSLIIRSFDPLTPLNGEAWNQAECSMDFDVQLSREKSSKKIHYEHFDLTFESEIYSGQINESFGSTSFIYNNNEPIRFEMKKSRWNFSSPIDLTFELINQSSSTSFFHLDPFAGLIKYHSFDRLASKYSLLIIGKSSSTSIFAVTSLNIDVHRFPSTTNQRQSLQSIYEFRIYTPFVNNSTIGFLNQTRKYFKILNEQMEKMISIESTGRLSIKNRNFILTNGNFYDFLIQDEFEQIARIQISILGSIQSSFDCLWSPFHRITNDEYLGFVHSPNENETICSTKKRSIFSLRNYHDRFYLDREQGLLMNINENSTNDDEYLLLIQIDQTSCLLNLDRRRFSSRSIEFEVNLNEKTTPIIVGQIQLNKPIYQFVTRQKFFRLDPENGQIEFYPSTSFNSSEETLQILGRDLIRKEISTTNVTMKFHRENRREFSSKIYSKNFSEITPIGSTLFRSNRSDVLLRRADPNRFHLDSSTGEILLSKMFDENFYSFELFDTSNNEIVVLKFNIEPFNHHAPNFLHLSSSIVADLTDEFITKISANDDDLISEKNFFYFLLDHHEDFQLNSSNGILTRRQTSMNGNDVQLSIGVTDGLFVTKTFLQIHFFNSSRHAPKFSAETFFFTYDETTTNFGPILATDDDPNDELFYQLHDAPFGIEIHPISAILTLNSSIIFEPTIELNISATDLAEQTIFTRIILTHSIEPKFSSNLFQISIRSSDFRFPMEIFQFDLFDAFYRRLNSTRFRLENSSETFSIVETKLFIRQQILPLEIYRLKIRGFWSNFICETFVEIRLVENSFFFEKNFYQIEFETKNFSTPIDIFPTETNRSFSTIETPLTRNRCHEDFQILNGKFVFTSNRIRSSRCFFELRFHQTILFDVKFIETTTKSNEIRPRRKKNFNVPTNFDDVELCENSPIVLTETNLPGTVIQDVRQPNETSNRTDYSIFHGDFYGLFAVNKFGQLYLKSSKLNRTNDEFFSLIILISSPRTISFCRTKISIERRTRWSRFICPPMPMRSIVDEESPLGTVIIKLNDQLRQFNDEIEQIRYRIDSMSNEFLIDSTTGTITSNVRLDFEEKSSFNLSILLEPIETNCRLTILVDLNNLNDNPVIFDRTSLFYNVTEHEKTPMILGRVKLIDLDRLSPIEFDFSLSNESSLISIDSRTGSIILQNELDREIHGENLTFEIIARDYWNPERNLTDSLILHINDINDHGPKFSSSNIVFNISKSYRIGVELFQINATSADPQMNEPISYSFVEPTDYFQLDSNSGVVRLKKIFPSTLTNLTLIIEAKERGISFSDRTKIFLSIVNDEKEFFDLEQTKKCFIEENQLIGTDVCRIGKNGEDFLYQFNVSNEYFDLIETNGTIRTKKIFDFENDRHTFDLTILVKDRENRSNLLSSMNLTVSLINLNDHRPMIISENFTTLVFLYYPSINANLHQIFLRDDDRSNLTFEMIENSSAEFYFLSSTTNSTSILLHRSIETDRNDNLTIRISDENFSIDVHLQLIFLQRTIDLPEILPQTIDGYINIDSNSSTINFGVLTVKNHSSFPLISFNLHSNENFFLKTISSNQTELHWRSTSTKSRLLHYQIQLTAIAFHSTDLSFLSNKTQTKIFLPSSIQSSLKIHPIDVHLWSIDREMLDRTLSIVVNLQTHSTYEDFLIESVPMIREHLAQLIGVQLRHIHLYTFERKTIDQIELLLAIIRYPSRLKPSRYIHKKFIYNVLKNSTNLFQTIPHVRSIEKLFLSQCQMKSCENNGRCTSHLKLFDQQYEYFTSGHYQRLIPKYQWTIKCLCLNHFHGSRCQYQQDYSSPCSSNPCSATERCIEESSTLYTCQCVDEPCVTNEILFEKSLDCINMNSATCRDASNTLTFDGYSYVRMNISLNLTQHTNLSFTFRTQVSQGKLIKLISRDEKRKTHVLTIQVLDGRLNIELNEKILLEINEITVHDGLWHTIEFSMDYSLTNQYSYYLLRLDHVFSNRFHLYQSLLSHRFEQILIGNDFHGCLGNLTMNNRTIALQKQSSSSSSIDHIGTNDGCQLTEMSTRTLREFSTNDEDLCSLYHPCYNGGLCTSLKTTNGVRFNCNCLKPRFAGRQCQLDLQPCQSNPCRFDEQCIPGTSTYDNRTYSCISSLVALPMSTKNPLYIGLAVTFCTLILFVLLFISFIIYCQNERKDKQRQDQFHHEKPLVSAPLLIQKSSPSAPTTTANQSVESPMQTLLKYNQQSKQNVETLPLVDKTPLPTSTNNFNEKGLTKSSLSIDKQQSPPSKECSTPHRRDSKGYATIDRLNIPPDNFLVHYNAVEYDQTRIPLVDPSATDLFDFPSTPTKYFNGHQETLTNPYQVRINSLSDLTERLHGQNDIEMTQSSNDSSNNEQTLLTSPVNNGERKRRSLFQLNSDSSSNLRTSSNSLSKAPVYAKIIKTASKPTNGGLSTIERLRLSGSPLRLLTSSSSPNYTRTTSFLKATTAETSSRQPLSTTPEHELLPTISNSKSGKTTPTSWKLNPRKLDSLKVRRNSRQMDGDDDQMSDDGQHSHRSNNDRCQLTTSTALQRLRHASESDLTHENQQGKKNSKLSSFFQTEV